MPQGGARDGAGRKKNPPHLGRVRIGQECENRFRQKLDAAKLERHTRRVHEANPDLKKARTEAREAREPIIVRQQRWEFADAARAQAEEDAAAARAAYEKRIHTFGTLGPASEKLLEKAEDAGALAALRHEEEARERASLDEWIASPQYARGKDRYDWAASEAESETDETGLRLKLSERERENRADVVKESSEPADPGLSLRLYSIKQPRRPRGFRESIVEEVTVWACAKWPDSDITKSVVRECWKEFRRDNWPAR